MSFKERLHWVVIAIVIAIVVVGLDRGFASAETQDVSGLDRRISMLEQRFYSLETSMNRLQQAVTSQRSTGSSSDLVAREVDQLRQEMQSLQLRLKEAECGLIKLDERTVSSGKSKNPESKATDPCRLNSDLPLRLSARP